MSDNKSFNAALKKNLESIIDTNQIHAYESGNSSMFNAVLKENYGSGRMQIVRDKGLDTLKINISILGSSPASYNYDGKPALYDENDEDKDIQRNIAGDLARKINALGRYVIKIAKGEPVEPIK